MKHLFCILCLLASKVALAQWYTPSNYYIDSQTGSAVFSGTPNGIFAVDLANLDSVYKGFCIGGQICGGTNRKLVYVRGFASTNIRSIEVYAHDQVGDTTKANLILRVDGVDKGRLDVLKDGGFISWQAHLSPSSTDRNRGYFQVNDRIEIISVREDNVSGGDETVIQKIRILYY